MGYATKTIGVDQLKDYLFLMPEALALAPIVVSNMVYPFFCVNFAACGRLELMRVRDKGANVNFYVKSTKNDERVKKLYEEEVFDGDVKYHLGWTSKRRTGQN